MNFRQSTLESGHGPRFSAQLASHLPYPLACRILHFTPHSSMARHRSDWGELNFAISGIMEIGIEGVLYLSPPQYAIWIPPGVSHCCQNEGEVHYACIDIPAAACAGLPAAPARWRSAPSCAPCWPISSGAASPIRIRRKTGAWRRW